MSIRSKFIIREEDSSKHYRTEIPNIIFHLGLNAYELALYLTLKRSAGASKKGMCTKKTPTLAKESGMSSGMVSKTKASLNAPRDELSGKSLIHIQKTKNRDGGKPLHKITVVDIWAENFRFFLGKKPDQVQVSGKIASSCGEFANSPRELASSPHELASSRGEIKKNKSKEEPIKESIASRAPLPFSKEKKNMLNFLIQESICQKTALYWVETYEIQQIKDAFELYDERVSNGILIRNKAGFIRKSLDEGWKAITPVEKENKSFAEEFKKKNEWKNLNITAKYISIPKLAVDLYFKMDQNQFRESLIKYYELSEIYGETG